MASDCAALQGAGTPTAASQDDGEGASPRSASRGPSAPASRACGNAAAS
jgi:hypothetical protein